MPFFKTKKTLSSLQLLSLLCYLHLWKSQTKALVSRVEKRAQTDGTRTESEREGRGIKSLDPQCRMSSSSHLSASARHHLALAFHRHRHHQRGGRGPEGVAGTRSAALEQGERALVLCRSFPFFRFVRLEKKREEKVMKGKKTEQKLKTLDSVEWRRRPVEVVFNI